MHAISTAAFVSVLALVPSLAAAIPATNPTQQPQCTQTYTVPSPTATLPTPAPTRNPSPCPQLWVLVPPWGHPFPCPPHFAARTPNPSHHNGVVLVIALGPSQKRASIPWLKRQNIYAYMRKCNTKEKEQLPWQMRTVGDGSMATCSGENVSAVWSLVMLLKLHKETLVRGWVAASPIVVVATVVVSRLQSSSLSSPCGHLDSGRGRVVAASLHRSSSSLPLPPRIDMVVVVVVAVTTKWSSRFIVALPLPPRRAIVVDCVLLIIATESTKVAELPMVRVDEVDELVVMDEELVELIEPVEVVLDVDELGLKQITLTEELEIEEEDDELEAIKFETEESCGKGVGEGEGLGDGVEEVLPTG
ncbi:hypothetical protein EDB84DRAFT_1622060 [Lactarius hengduanensis]|nr:hypothetical protein EDB84DRAFT_1622060 [Lactarius hengduanensis]